MEALASSPRALFAGTASPATALATPARWTPSSTRRVKAAAAAEPAGEAKPAAAAASPAPKKILKKKPVYSMKKGQIVRVEKEKYLNSINYLSVGHPPFYKGLDYIYEDRGEAINFDLIAWVGIPTPPAWLPTYMLIKSDKLDYERI
ncbi:NAD(P)H-quinone oxidoreductase subunit O, chloroplastic [Hordeum vulgare]|nr:NAD(P)H-quinone oxidoreductase subunit O, chloroplastic [Hordeum vulgare]